MTTKKENPTVPLGSVVVQPWPCTECGVQHNATARLHGKDGNWYDANVSFRMSDGTPINTGWYVKVDDDGQGQRIECNICHHRVEFPGDFWGMEYDTNGNGVFRNVFIDGYFCPFE